jgi:tripartite ATP-independent transporter DctM subunit
MFVLLGEMMFQSGMGSRILDVLDQWLGRLPGRLALMSVGWSAMFSTMTGNMIATAAMLGKMLIPEMERRGYKKPMSIGPIMGAGGLAMIIPPSGLAVLLGALGDVSIGRLLIGGIIPGLLIAAFYATYIIVRCWLQSSIAPPYEVITPTLAQKIVATIRYVIPLGLIIFLVLGIMFLGIATPTEAAVSGAIGSFILSAFYRKLNWNVVTNSLIGTLEITVMVLMIIVGAMTFTQILAFSGATQGLTRFVVELPLSPFAIIVCMQIALLFLGAFMDIVAIMMITVPLYIPIVKALGFDTVWFGLIMLINIEMAMTTPPFGMLLFVTKGVAPPDTKMIDIYKAGFPFLLCDATAMGLIMAFPNLALWLPNQMI